MSFDLAVMNGDLVIKSGDLAQITGEDKLVQDLLKIALTTAGSNPLQPWYGSLLSQSLIGSYINSSVVISVAQSQLQNAIQNLQTLQQLQVQSGQSVSPAEQIASIKNVSIVKNTIDPRLYQVVIQVINRQFGTVSATFGVNNT
jgi:phage baseplate assembly protein W